MRIAVTGGLGFVGAHLVPRLLDSPRTEVIIVDDHRVGAVPEALAGLPDDRLDVIIGDAADADLVGPVIAAADAVIHLAASTSVDRSIEEPRGCIVNNVGATAALVQSVLEHRPRRVVAVSTDEVWGSVPAPELADELTPYAPTNPYAASKAACDHIVAAANHTYGLGITTVWFTNLYGPWQLPGKLIATAVSNRVIGRRVPIHGDGLAIREFTYVEDAVDGLAAVFRDGPQGEDYIVGSGVRFAAIDAAREVDRIIGGEGDWLTFAPERPGCDQRYAVDSAKIRTDLGWAPKADFQDGIQQTADWWRTVGVVAAGNGRHHGRAADHVGVPVALQPEG